MGARLDLALRRARRSGEPTLATSTVRLPGGVDPSAVVCASRREGEAWFAFEQPDRGGAALAALGEAVCLSGSGEERFASVADRWRELAARAVGDPLDDPDRSGPVAVGGFAFAPEGGGTPVWEGFDPASMVVPEVAIRRVAKGARDRGEPRCEADAGGADGTRMTPPRRRSARLEGRLAELHQQALPLLDPSPTGRYRVASAMPPEHYEAAVRHATALIGEGKLEKIVLAREVQTHAPREYDPAAMLGVLREAFPGCFCFCVGRGDATLIAASPELLVRREGHRVSTLALAGSTRRSADPAVDDHLGEQLLRDESYREEHAIVARRIERTLRPHAVWVRGRSGAGAGEDREHPASRDPDPRAARRPDRRAGAGGPDAPDPGGRGRAARRGDSADPGAGGVGPRLVRGTRRLDRRNGRRRVLRRPALRAATRKRRPLLCG